MSGSTLCRRPGGRFTVETSALPPALDLELLMILVALQISQLKGFVVFSLFRRCFLAGMELSVAAIENNYNQ